MRTFFINFNIVRIINDPVEVFKRMLKEKDEEKLRNRILKESRRRHSRSPKSNYSNSRSRSSSFGRSSRGYSSRSRSRSLSPFRSAHRHRGRKYEPYRANRGYARSRSRSRSPSGRYHRRRRHRSKSVSNNNRYYKDRYDGPDRRGRPYSGVNRRYEDNVGSHYSRNPKMPRSRYYNGPMDYSGYNKEEMGLHLRYTLPYNAAGGMPQTNYPAEANRLFFNNSNSKMTVIGQLFKNLKFSLALIKC